MWKNYLLIAIRNFKKSKVFSFINVLGLALGMACSLLIFLWVNDEKGIDAFHKDSDRIFSLYERQYYDNKVEGQYSTPGIMAGEMKKVLPEVEYATHMTWNKLCTFEANDKILKALGNNATSDYFKVFSYRLLAGKAETALASPISIAISEKMAKDYFDTPENALGKTLRYQNRKDLRVDAVFANTPSNSSYKYDYLINWETFLEENNWAKEWGNNGPATIIKLRKDADPAAFEKKITRFLDHYNKEQDAGFHIELGIQKFADRYLYSNFKDGKVDGGRIEYVNLFSIVAIFILLIACVNFMNLTTARSIKRSKEIGIRKVVGAIKSSLIKQFIGEAILLAFISVLLALAICFLVLPVFNSITHKQIQIPFNSIQFWTNTLLLTLITGIVSGSYPALFISSFNPIRVIKGTLRFKPSHAYFRKGLVIFQFALSIILIIATIIVSKQVSYIQSRNLGYDRENLLYLPMDGEIPGKYELFKQQALQAQGVKLVTRMSDMPTEIDNSTGGVKWEGKDPNTRPMFTQSAIGYDFSKTMGITILEGRDFSKDFKTDSVGYILNEQALAKISYTDPIGKPLTFWGKKGTIIGIYKDFHFNSLHVKVEPIVLRLGESDDWGNVLVRTEAGKTQQALAGLEKIWKNLNPKFPFTYRFSSEEYNELYKSEQTTGALSDIFAFLAIFISSLGLLGLAIFTAEQKTKEFGIRKVLGATVQSLFALLSREFLLLVLLALLIAVPVAWWAMNNWLDNYAYRTPIGWSVFAIAGLAALLIALLTVSFQAIKAAIANPVKSLRTE